MFPRLTAATCDCCDRTEVDEVALVVIEEAVVSFRDALLAKIERDERAWSDAEQQSRDAIAAVKASHGAGAQW